MASCNASLSLYCLLRSDGIGHDGTTRAKGLLRTDRRIARGLMFNLGIEFGTEQHNDGRYPQPNAPGIPAWPPRTARAQYLALTSVRWTLIFFTRDSVSCVFGSVTVRTPSLNSRWPCPYALPTASRRSRKIHSGIKASALMATRAASENERGRQLATFRGIEQKNKNRVAFVISLI